jgi:hypothetical protein
MAILRVGNRAGTKSRRIRFCERRVGSLQMREGVMPSTVIRDFDYDADICELEITFVTGRVYVYSAVPEDVFEDFLAASSKGEFFNAHIRNAYAYREITPAS